jgi:hypothetical protein
VKVIDGGKCDDQAEPSGLDRILSRSTYEGWQAVTVSAETPPLTLESIQAAWTRAFVASCDAMGRPHLYAVKDA